jgi:hypothetical protein
MHLNAILFLSLYLFGPGPLPLPFSFSSLYFFHAAQAQPAFLPLHPFSPAQPNSPSCLRPSPGLVRPRAPSLLLLALANKGGPPVRVFSDLELEPGSDSR